MLNYQSKIKLTKDELNKKITKAEIISRNKLISLLNEYGCTFEYKSMDIHCKYDLLLITGDNLYIVEQKHRNNYDFKTPIIQQGCMFNFDKFEHLLNEYEASNYTLLPVYTSTFDKNNNKVIVWYNLQNLPYSEIKQCYDELKQKLDDRIKYLEDLGEEPNKYNLKHLTNKWCCIEWIKKVYEDPNSPKIPQVRILLPLPNEYNKFGKIMHIN